MKKWIVRNFDKYIYTTQKKLRIDCAYSVVLSTSNVCRLLKDEHIKLRYSEDILNITISNFCEKQLISNAATSIIKKSLFYPKIQNFSNFMFKHCLYHQCLELYQN